MCVAETLSLKMCCFVSFLQWTLEQAPFSPVSTRPYLTHRTVVFLLLCVCVYVLRSGVGCGEGGGGSPRNRCILLGFGVVRLSVLLTMTCLQGSFDDLYTVLVL